jgi:hypothetical protein
LGEKELTRKEGVIFTPSFYLRRLNIAPKRTLRTISPITHSGSLDLVLSFETCRISNQRKRMTVMPMMPKVMKLSLERMLTLTHIQMGMRIIIHHIMKSFIAYSFARGKRGFYGNIVS